MQIEDFVKDVDQILDLHFKIILSLLMIQEKLKYVKNKHTALFNDMSVINKRLNFILDSEEEDQGDELMEGDYEMNEDQSNDWSIDEKVEAVVKD